MRKTMNKSKSRNMNQGAVLKSTQHIGAAMDIYKTLLEKPKMYIDGKLVTDINAYKQIKGPLKKPDFTNQKKLYERYQKQIEDE